MVCTYSRVLLTCIGEKLGVDGNAGPQILGVDLGVGTEGKQLLVNQEQTGLGLAQPAFLERCRRAS